MKYEWRKQEKEFYLPKKPMIIQVPTYSFITLSDEGNPNREAFAEQISALYNVSYALRMGIKKGAFGDAPFEYTVYPLEGVWTTPEKPEGAVNKDELIYKIMIRQPKQVTETLFEEQRLAVQKKKQNSFLEKLAFETYEEGQVVQAMHIGPYDTERETFAQMESYLETTNMQVVPTMGHYQHREIYLSDPRKSAPEKAKTVLRWKVAPQAKKE